LQGRPQSPDPESLRCGVGGLKLAHIFNAMAAATQLLDKKLLRTLVPLNGLSAPHFDEVAKKGVIEQLPAGRILFRQGKRDGLALFLLEGEVALLDGNEVKAVIRAGSEEARHALAPQQPRQFTGKVASRATVLKIDSGLLDVLLAWDQSNSYEVTEIQSEDNEDWMTRMLQSELFQRLPATNIQQMIMRMEEVPMRAGDVVVRQDEEGDYYYIIKHGVAAVTRTPSSSARPVKVAELRDGDSFGEESLVSGGQRNATVTMLTDGNLMRLSNADFDALLGAPLLNRLDYAEAKKLVAKGATWLDVRLPGEYQNAHLPHSINVPLAAVRDASAELDPDETYIVCCDTATRSAGAAFLLNQRGLEAYVLDEGLGSVPHSELEAAAPRDTGGAEIIAFQAGRDNGRSAGKGEAGREPEAGAEVGQAGEELALLRAELDDARSQLAELEASAAAKREELKALAAEGGRTRELQKELERLSGEAEPARKRAESLERELKEARRAQESLDKRLAQTAEALESTKTSLQELESAKQKSDDELAQARADLEARSEEQQKLQARIEALEQESSRGTDEAQRQVAELERRNSELEQAVGVQEASRTALEQELKALGDARDQAVADWEQKLSALQQERDRIEAEREAQVAAHERLEHELKGLREGQSDQERATAQRIEALEQERVELQQQLDARSKAQEKLEAERDQLNQAQQDLEQSHARQIEELEQARSELQAELDQREVSRQQAADELDALRAAQAALQQEHEQTRVGLEAELESLRQAREEVEGEAGGRIRELEEERDRLTGEAAAQSQRVQALEADAARLGTELSEQAESRAGLEKQLAEFQAEREDLRAELERVRQAREEVEGEAGGRIRELEEERDRLAGEAAAQTERLQALEAEQERLAAALGEQSELRARLEASVAEAEQAGRAADDRAASLEAELAAARAAATDERAALDSQLQSLRDAAAEAEREHETRIAELEQAQGDATTTLSEQLEALGRQLESEREAHAAAEAALEDARTGLEESGRSVDARIVELQKHVGEVEAQLRAQEEARAQAEKSVASLQAEQAQRASQLEKIGSERSGLGQRVAELEQRVREATQERDAAHLKAADARKTVEEANSQRIDTEASLQVVEREAESLRTELEELAAVRGKWEQEREDLEGRIAELEQEGRDLAQQHAERVSDDAGHEAEELRAQVEALNRALEHQAPEEIQAEIASIRELADRELEQAAEQLNAMRRDLSASNQRAVSAEGRVKELNNAVGAAERRLKSLESELALSRQVTAAPISGDVAGTSSSRPDVDPQAVSRLEQENAQLRDQILRIQREQESAHMGMAPAAAARGQDIFDLGGADDAMFAAAERRPRAGKGVMAGAAALVLIVMGAGGYWWYSGGSGGGIPAVSEPETALQVPAPVPEAAPTKPIEAPAVRAGRTYQDFLKSGGVGPVMIEIPAGRFDMGTGPGFPYFDERPRHQVTLPGFSISKYEVTFEEYDRFAAATGRAKPSDEGWGRGRRPVVNVDWDDAVAYAAWLSAQTGHSYRLASESQWEYANRAGSTSKYWWGDDIGKGHANCLNCGSKWDGDQTAPVGSFAPNPLGLDDTAGNALEWVQDCYHRNYDGAPTDGSAWLGRDCAERVARGGSYRTPADSVRSTKRSHFSPAVRADYIGFRVVRDK